IDPTEEMHALRFDVDFALVPGAVEAAELRMRDELAGCVLRQVPVAARDVHATDAELALLSVGQRAKLIDLKDDVGDVRERRADGDGLARPQALAARVGARFGRAVGIDDLPPA